MDHKKTKACALIAFKKERPTLSSANMMRSAVLTSLKDQGRSRYWLATKLAANGVCGTDAVYRWLRGSNDTTTSVAHAAMKELKCCVVLEQA